jgi:hypothetical protein
VPLIGPLLAATVGKVIRLGPLVLSPCLTCDRVGALCPTPCNPYEVQNTTQATPWRPGVSTLGR